MKEVKPHPPLAADYEDQLPILDGFLIELTYCDICFFAYARG